MEILKNVISQMIRLTDNEAENFMSLCYRKMFKKKEILSEDEKIIDEVYFIESGILRVKIFDINEPLCLS